MRLVVNEGNTFTVTEILNPLFCSIPLWKVAHFKFAMSHGLYPLLAQLYRDRNMYKDPYSLHNFTVIYSACYVRARKWLIPKIKYSLADRFVSEMNKYAPT